MRQSVWIAAAAAAVMHASALPAHGSAHGSVFPPPKPNGWAVPGPGSAKPGSAGPTPPALGGGSTGAPGAGVPGAPASGTAGGPATGALTPGPVPREAVSSWVNWWELNKDPYLGLHFELTPFPETGDDDWDPAPLLPTRAEIEQVVVPALERSLAREKNPSVLTAALVARARITRFAPPADPAALVELFTPFLAANNQDVAETAALGLGLIATPDAVGVLIPLLEDAPRGRDLVGSTSVPARTRAFAAYGLSLAAPALESPWRERAVAALARTIQRSDGATRDVEVAAVTALGVLPLTDRPAPPGPDDPPGAVRSFQDQIAALLELLDDGDRPRGRPRPRPHRSGTPAGEPRRGLAARALRRPRRGAARRARGGPLRAARGRARLYRRPRQHRRCGPRPDRPPHPRGTDRRDPEEPRPPDGAAWR